MRQFLIGIALVVIAVAATAQTPGQSTLIRTAASDPANCKAASEIYGSTSLAAIRFCNATNSWETITQTIWSGQITLSSLGTILAQSKQSSLVTVSAPGVNPSSPNYDKVSCGFPSDPSGTTGYQPTGPLTIVPFVTSGNVNIWVYNTSAVPVTPGSISVNCQVTR
jgi:hypothetical protein